MAGTPCARRMGNLPPDPDGLRRILSNPAFSPNALTPGDALVLLEANLGHPAHHFWTDEISFVQALEPFVARLTGPPTSDRCLFVRACGA